MKISGRHHDLVALSQGKNHDTHWKGGCISRRVGLDVSEENFASSRTRTQINPSLAYYYTNCAILTPLINACLFIILKNLH